MIQCEVDTIHTTGGPPPRQIRSSLPTEIGTVGDSDGVAVFLVDARYGTLDYAAIEL